MIEKLAKYFPGEENIYYPGGLIYSMEIDDILDFIINNVDGGTDKILKVLDDEFEDKSAVIYSKAICEGEYVHFLLTKFPSTGELLLILSKDKKIMKNWLTLPDSPLEPFHKDYFKIIDKNNLV